MLSLAQMQSISARPSVGLSLDAKRATRGGARNVRATTRNRNDRYDDDDYVVPTTIPTRQGTGHTHHTHPIICSNQRISSPQHRGLHSFTFQLNLSRIRHTETPHTP